MKLTAILATTLLAATTSAYRIDVWAGEQYQNTQRAYSTKGSHSPGFAIKSWKWQSNIGDGCCVVFCKGSSNVGKFCGSTDKPVSSAGANKVVTGCNNDVLNC